MMHEGRETRASQNKYADEIEQLQRTLDEKKTFLQTCAMQADYNSKLIQNDQSEKKQITELEQYCRQEQLVKKDYIEFICKGKVQCKVQVPLEQRNQLKAHIVDLDPFSGIDQQAVNEIIKKMEQKEIYDYERDRPGPSIVQEQFDKIVDERFRRVKMEKRKGEEKRSLENLQAFNKWYAEQVNELEDQLRIVAKK